MGHTEEEVLPAPSGYELQAEWHAVRGTSRLKDRQRRLAAKVEAGGELGERHALFAGRGRRCGRTRWDGRVDEEVDVFGRRCNPARLEQPAERFRFESEGALKAYFADATTLEHLRAHLERLAAQLLGGPERDPTLSADLLAGRAGFRDRLHLTAMTVDLVVRVNTAMRDRAVHWLANTEAWSSTTIDDTSEQQARAEILAARRRLRRRVERDGR